MILGCLAAFRSLSSGSSRPSSRLVLHRASSVGRLACRELTSRSARLGSLQRGARELPQLTGHLCQVGELVRSQLLEVELSLGKEDQFSSWCLGWSWRPGRLGLHRFSIMARRIIHIIIICLDYPIYIFNWRNYSEKITGLFTTIHNKNLQFTYICNIPFKDHFIFTIQNFQSNNTFRAASIGLPSCSFTI